MAKTSNVLYPIYVKEKCASIDYKFGPFASKEQAIYELNKIGALAEGLEIGIKVDGVTTRYYFKGGVTEAHLVPMDGGAGSGTELEQCKCNLIERGYTDGADGGLKLVLVKKDNNRIEVVFPTATKQWHGVMSPGMIETVETASDRASRAITAANTAVGLISKADDAVSKVAELLTKFAEDGSGADNIAAQVILNTNRITQLEGMTGGSGAGSLKVEKGTFKQAYVKAQDSDEPFVWILDDTINDISICKPIWHVGNKKFVDAIGAEIVGNVVKPVVMITPASGLQEFPLTVTANAEPADSVVYINGEERNTIVLDEPGTVDAYAMYDGVVGDMVTAEYTGNNAGIFFANGALGPDVSMYAKDGSATSPATISDGLIKIESAAKNRTLTYLSGVYAKDGQTGNVKIEFNAAYANNSTSYVIFSLTNWSNAELSSVTVMSRDLSESGDNTIIIPSVACSTERFKVLIGCHFKPTTIKSIIVEH